MRNIIKKALVLSSLLVVFILSSITISAQTITGKVTNSRDGSGIAGVTVSVKGNKTAVQTGVDGSFKIAVPATIYCKLNSYSIYSRKL